jgi:hypothetical protein
MRLADTIREIWRQYDRSPSLALERAFIRRYPLSSNYRLILTRRPKGVEGPDPLELSL